MRSPLRKQDAPGSARSPAGRGARPTRWAAVLVGVVAIITVVLPVGVILPILLTCGVAGCVLIDIVVARRSRPESERTPAPTLALLAPVPFSLSVAAPRARSVRLRQPVGPELGVEPAEVVGPRLEGHLVGRHRGIHPLPSAVVRVTGPLGLGSCDHRVVGTEEVMVLPDLPRARRMAVARRRGRQSDEGRSYFRIGIGTEFDTVREYSPNDDSRQINWPATFRVGRPMANQYRLEENRDLMCVVDAGRLMASPVGQVTRLDVALDALAVLAVAAEEAGDRVGAIAFAAAVSRQLEPRRRGAEAVVRALFDLEPVEVESDYERAFLAVAQRKRALVVLFTDLVDEAASRSLLSALPMLARRHAVLVASCRDPDLTRAVATEPRELRDVLAASVALDLLASRNRAAALLRANGARVVEASPQQLGAACVDAYLSLKQRARL